MLKLMKLMMQREKSKRAIELGNGAQQGCAQNGQGRHAKSSCIFQRSPYRHLPRQHQSRRHAAKVTVSKSHHCGLSSHKQFMPDDAMSVPFRFIARLPHLCHTATSSHVLHTIHRIYSQKPLERWPPLHTHVYVQGSSNAVTVSR